MKEYEFEAACDLSGEEISKIEAIINIAASRAMKDAFNHLKLFACPSTVGASVSIVHNDNCTLKFDLSDLIKECLDLLSDAPAEREEKKQELVKMIAAL